MDPKLAFFVVLIGSIIAMSHLNEDLIARLKRHIAMRHWRPIGPQRRKA
ncbi:MAG: hypothetical protein JOZ70_02995 [Pseudolabrys sp.]|nr:hypothetical protein [Pseudolabrys sp.]MBV9954195.1 hypothetical protein [Pseudolabrys sp.]